MLLHSKLYTDNVEMINISSIVHLLLWKYCSSLERLVNTILVMQPMTEKTLASTVVKLRCILFEIYSFSINTYKYISFPCVCMLKTFISSAAYMDRNCTGQSLEYHIQGHFKSRDRSKKRRNFCIFVIHVSRSASAPLDRPACFGLFCFFPVNVLLLSCYTEQPFCIYVRFSSPYT